MVQIRPAEVFATQDAFDTAHDSSAEHFGIRMMIQDLGPALVRVIKNNGNGTGLGKIHPHDSIVRWKIEDIEGRPGCVQFNAKRV
jgi:hypothetical protein